MFTTSLTAALVGGLMASGSLESPKWQTSYRAAASAAADLRKPIAVFITSSTPGKLVKEGYLDKGASRLLRDGFVPLIVNTSTDAGKELATTFNLTEGLVISDRTGGVQALRHTGTLTASELNGYLERFAAPSAVITTEYRGIPAAPAVTVQPPQYVQPTYQPQYTQPTTYQPQYQPVYQPQYAEPQRPVLNAVQNIGATAIRTGVNTVQFGVNAVQNVGGYVLGGFSSGGTCRNGNCNR